MGKRFWIIGLILLYNCCFSSLGWADYTNSKLVTLVISATDDGSGMGSGAQMMFSNDGLNWSVPEPFATIKTGWDLTAYGGGEEDGQKTVYLKLKDSAGNWSTDEITASIILELDTDGDGMPDWWEKEYNLDPNANDADQDDDQDGYTNLEEYLAGWNPTHSALTIHVDDDAPSGGDGTAEFPLNNIHQAIEQAIDADTILVLEGNYIEGQGLLMRERVDLVCESGARCTIDLDGSGFIEGVNYSTITRFKIINPLNNSGAITCPGTSPTIYNNVIIPSTDGTTGILLTNSSSAQIINNTILDAYIGIEIDSASPTIKNNIIIDNIMGIVTNGGSPVIDYNNVWGNLGAESCPSGDYCGATPGTHDISADPLFVGGSYYQLTADSPCIDAGTAEGAPSDDIDGDIRPQGAGYDIGADEYTGSDVCTDADSDGYYVPAGCGTEVDCDDSNANTHPGALELCDGIDNDCDPGTGDGVDEAWLDTACDGTDSDLCEEGVLECVAGVQICSDTTGDDLEQCDGIDNNCDDLIDEGFDDTDGDGIADCVDSDIDNDGIENADDNCPLIKNIDQTDTDVDGIGDACDNCPDDPNAEQSDVDEDGIGDICDEDTMLTPAGSDVVLDFNEINSALDVSIIFSQVIVSGYTSVNVNDTGPELPDGFEIAGSYYDIETSAIFSGVIEVCIYYDDTDMSETEEQNLALLHWENGVDVTSFLDTDNNMICGQVTSFSLFVIGEYNAGGDTGGDSNIGNADVGGDGSGGNGGCFIATAAYGTPMAKEVQILCRFRDTYLLPNFLGRKLVSLYYKISPPIARYIKNNAYLKAATRNILRPVVWLTQNFFIKCGNGEILEEAVYDDTITDGSASKNQPTRSKSYRKASSLKIQPSTSPQLKKSSATTLTRSPNTGKKLKRKKHIAFFGYLRLVGTTVFEDNILKNKAIIEDLLSSQQKSYVVGSVIPYGAKIIRIHERGIVLDKEGVRKQLAIADELGNPGDIAVLKAKGYKKVAEKEWLINPNSLIGNTENIFKLLAQVSIWPFINAGKIGGFKVNEIEQEAVVKKLGINEGDVINTVNGKTIDSLAKAYEVYQQIRKEPIIKLGIKRQQQEIALAYHIIPDGKPKYSIKQALQSSTISGIFDRR
jgi:parallel beta-helix repeat protein